MIIFACAVMVIVGIAYMVMAVRYGRDTREMWIAYDMVYPATWAPGDSEGNWRVTITIPPNHSKPDVSIKLEDDVVRSWEELDGG